MLKFPATNRQGFFLVAIGLVLLLCIGGLAVFLPRDDKAHSQLLSPVSGTGYGFTVSYLPVEGSTNGLAGFQRDVDTLVENGQQWIRFGITGWEVVDTWGDEKSMKWNEETLKGYDEAIAYAKAKGLSIYLVTADGHMGLDASSAEYRDMMREYWSVLAERYAQDVTVWQLYNEVDAGHYSQWTVFEGQLSESYLAGLKTMLQIGREAVKDAHSPTMVTTNTMGWPMDDKTEKRWERFFDAVESTLDVIAIDVYPVHYRDEIAKLDNRVENMENRYDKPVIVAELGLQTCSECWSEEDQGTYVAAAVDSLEQASPWAIIVYQFRDEPSDTGFGVMHPDWRKKSGFEKIITAMTVQ